MPVRTAVVAAQAEAGQRLVWRGAGENPRQPGAAPFVPDPAFPARQALQGVYYAQRVFRAKNSRWAASLEELGLPAGAMEGLASPPTIKSTKNGYEATAETKRANGISQRWHIRQDARVWSD